MQFDLLGKAVRRFRLPTVDYAGAPIIIIPVQEGDVNSRFFEITLYDDRGDLDLSIYTKATLRGTTPSDVVLTSTDCEIGDDHKSVIVQFGGGYTAKAGRVACDIMFTNAESTVALTTQTFYVIVSESQSGKVIKENDADYNELLSLLKEVGALENKIEAAENERVTAENARVSAENTRVAQETARQTNENARESNEDARKIAEAKRAESESERVMAEKQRISAEELRQANETDRIQAETNRVSAENLRVTAEAEREQDFLTAKTICETATERANTAADTVQEILDALPCDTEIERDGQTDSVIALRFVELKGG